MTTLTKQEAVKQTIIDIVNIPNLATPSVIDLYIEDCIHRNLWRRLSTISTEEPKKIDWVYKTKIYWICVCWKDHSKIEKTKDIEATIQLMLDNRPLDK